MMRRRERGVHPFAWGAVAIGAAFMAAPAWTQPEPPPGATPGAGANRAARPDGEPPERAGSMRQRAQQRAEQLKKTTEQLQKILADLKSGAEPASVTARLEQALGALEEWQQRPVFGGPGAPGGPEGGPGGPGGPGEGREGRGEGRGEGRDGREGRGAFGDLASILAPEEGERLAPLHPLTPEERAHVRGVVASRHPELGVLLGDIERVNAGMYEGLMSKIQSRLEPLGDLSGPGAAGFDLRLDELHSALKIGALRRQADAEATGGKDPEKMAAIRAELGTYLGKAFDSRQRLQQMQLDELRGRIQRMTNDIERTRANRESIITRRADDIMSQAGKRRGKPKDGARPDEGRHSEAKERERR